MSTDDQGGFAAAIEQHVQAVNLPDWPVFELAGFERESYLAGVGDTLDGPDVVDVVRIDSIRPSDDRRLITQTQPQHAVDLDALIAALDDAGDGEPLALVEPAGGPTGTSIVIAVDGDPREGRTARLGASQAWSVDIDGVTVVVAQTT